MPVIIPADTIEALKFLASPSVRQKVGLPKNDFIFANLGNILSLFGKI